MRFRVVLPLSNVVLAIVLLHFGDNQAEKILDIRRHDLEHEPVPDTYARARYLDYALNAPAWATLGEGRNMLWEPSLHRGRDLRYLLAVILMWYLLGFQLDKRTGAKRTDGGQQRKWRKRVLGLACVLYGLFLYNLMTPEFAPLGGSGHWLPLRRYELWFIAAV